MFLRFPNLDTLRLALTSGAIPDRVRTSAVRYGFDDDQSLWMQPVADLGETPADELRRLGVHFLSASKNDLPGDAIDWLQMLPLVRDPRSADLGDKTPVLFELTEEGQLAEIATEILRLGNDRQSFRWLDGVGGAKALLRVVGPPYYSLLRAMDRAGQDGAPVAYREVGPGVWVQIGFVHPLAEHVRPPASQWLLIRAPHQWTTIPEAKLRDIYEVIEFQLSDVGTAWHDHQLPAPIQVPVKLTRAGAQDAAELWVLREAGIAQLEEIVRTSDNELLTRLAFAVGEKEGERIVVLRARPSKNTPPVLVLDGLAFRSYLRIPNLFIPIGAALHPPLRRDAVVKLLADDKTRVTWLTPQAGGKFTPESLPDDAFRPLPEWVDYVLEHEHKAIQTWLGATQFQFEGFICKDDLAKEKKPPRESEPKQARKGNEEPVAKRKAIDVVEKKKPTPEPTVSTEAGVPPGELEKRLREAEDAYQALTTPLEDGGRQALWRDMAALNGALNQHGDAAVCWSNALWEAEGVTPDWPREWFRLEGKQTVGAAPPPANVFLRIVNRETPTQGSVRLVTAYLLWAAVTPTSHTEVRPYLGKVQDFLVKNESYLGVRTIWLAWHAMHQISGDVLTLARARDRLLERLYLHGLTPELDLPGFLRFTGLQANNRFRAIRDQVVRLHKLVQDWAKRGQNPTTQTHAYINLIFAFGLARLGETAEARNLLREAGAVLSPGVDADVPTDEVHRWLHDAFAYRIQQALDGKASLDSLPDTLLERLEAIDRPDYLSLGDPGEDVKRRLRFHRVVIERRRENSRILEPLERLEAYRRFGDPNADDLDRELTELTDVHDREELLRRFGQLFSGKRKFKGGTRTDVRIVIAAVEMAPRLGQAFAEETLDRVPGQLAKLKDAERIAEVLEKSVLLAAHCDRKEDVQRFVAQLHTLLQNPGVLPSDKLIPLITGTFRGLRKFGLRESAVDLLQRVSDLAAAGESPRAGAASHAEGKRLCLKLELAAGWLFFGDEARGRKILDEARGVLMSKQMSPVNQTEVACAYLTALGQAPMEFALARIMEFFNRVEGVYDNYTTLSHYSLSRLNVVEAMMLAIVSDDFTLDRAARQRLDDDEFLVRRRIHRDVRAALRAT